MHKRKIKKWLTDTINDGSWRNHNDLHVDEISKDFINPKTWVKGGLDCLDYAISVRDELKVNFLLQLFIDLRSKRKPMGINFKNIIELNNELGVTPPSLYLYQFSVKEKKKYDLLKAIELGGFNRKNINVFYSEKLIDQPEYYRSISFVSFPNN